MSDQDEAARQAFYRQLSPEAAAANTQDERDNPAAPATMIKANSPEPAPLRSP